MSITPARNVAHQHAASTVLKITRALRQLDPNMSSPVIETFFMVAAYPEITSRELQDQLGIAQSSVSRYLTELSHIRGGLDLVETYEDLANRRQKRARLTAKGKRLLDQVTEALESTDGKAKGR